MDSAIELFLQSLYETVLGVGVPNLRSMFKDGGFALTDNVIRLHCGKLRFIASLLTVFHMCGFQSSLLLLMVTLRYTLVSVILRMWPLRWYWCLVGFFLPGDVDDLPFV